jgi:hypothetical protein
VTVGSLTSPLLIVTSWMCTSFVHIGLGGEFYHTHDADNVTGGRVNGDGCALYAVSVWSATAAVPRVNHDLPPATTPQAHIQPVPGHGSQRGGSHVRTATIMLCVRACVRAPQLSSLWGGLAHTLETSMCCECTGTIHQNAVASKRSPSTLKLLE